MALDRALQRGPSCVEPLERVRDGDRAAVLAELAVAAIAAHPDAAAAIASANPTLVPQHTELDEVSRLWPIPAKPVGTIRTGR